MDLKRTQTEWTDLMREFVLWLRLHRQLSDFRRRYILERIRVLETHDEDDATSNWTFAGAIRNVNCTEDGRLFTNLNDETPGAGQAEVQVYSDSAKTALVAEGDAADNNTITLVEQNNSGLSGTVDIGVVAASDTDIVLLLDIDEESKGDAAFGASLGSRGSARSFKVKLTALGSALATELIIAKTDIENAFIRTRLQEFLKSPLTAVITVTEAVDSNGDALITQIGLLPELSDAMDDETVAPAQTVDRNLSTSSAPIFDPDNLGFGAITILALRDQLITGRITFTCTAGKATTLAETFSASIKADDGRILRAPLALTIKKEWESHFIGIRARLDRTIIDVEPVGPDQINTYVVNGETLTNTDVGKIYEELTDLAGTRTVKWFSNAAKTLLVAEGNGPDGVITMVEQNGSGLSGSCVVAFTGTDLGIVVDLQPFALNESFVIDVSNPRTGVIQTLFADIWGISLPSVVAPGTLPDAIIKESTDHIAAIS